MAHYIQILCLSTLPLINQRNVSDIKLSKYCHIDARLAQFQILIYDKFSIVNFILNWLLVLVDT